MPYGLNRGLGDIAQRVCPDGSVLPIGSTLPCPALMPPSLCPDGSVMLVNSLNPCPSTSAGSAVIAAQPTTGAAPIPQDTVAVSSGFDLSSIPTWAWLAAAAGVALVVFRGGR